MTVRFAARVTAAKTLVLETGRGVNRSTISVKRSSIVRDSFSARAVASGRLRTLWTYDIVELMEINESGYIDKYTTRICLEYAACLLVTWPDSHALR